MLENFKSKDWDFMLQSQKKLYAHSPQIISQLLGEVKLSGRIIEGWKDISYSAKNQVDEKDQQIQILKEALDKYAEKTNWSHPDGPGPDRHFVFIPALRTMIAGWNVAREALAKLNQVKGEV
jgi:hypothetical protein